MKMEGSASAVIDVTTENKIISPVNRDEYRDVDGISNYSVDNSLVQSPSIESFSTFHDIETVSELNMDQDTDLCVRIDSPQKQLATLETFILFRIITKVARIEYSESEYEVRRRYNDFSWLRQKLVETYPTHIVPPLPAKHTLIGQLDRYSKEFIITRMNLLNIFITRVVNHPILSYDTNLKIFLTANPTDFAAYRKSKTNVLSMVSDSIHNLTNVYTVKHKNSEFEKFKDYANILQEKLTTIEKISLRVNKERQEYVSELSSFYPIFNRWVSSEVVLAPLLTKIGCALEQSTNAQNVLINSYGTTLANPLGEFLMYIDAAKEVLNRRDSYQITYEHSMDDLSKKRCEKDQLIASQSNPSTANNTAHFALWKQPTNDQRLEKLGTDIPQLVKHTETLQDRLECANEALRSDLERWHLEKQASLKKMLIEFVNKHIQYYQECVNAWESVTEDMNSTALPPQNVPVNNSN